MGGLPRNCLQNIEASARTGKRPRVVQVAASAGKRAAAAEDVCVESIGSAAATAAIGSEAAAGLAASLLPAVTSAAATAAADYRSPAAAVPRG